MDISRYVGYGVLGCMTGVVSEIFTIPQTNLPVWASTGISMLVLILLVDFIKIMLRN